MLKINSGDDWTADDIEDIYAALDKISKEKYQLNIYPNQLEIITSEQMLDAYASHGLPVFYPHWSYGEQFVKQMEAYKRGYMGLAYEIVINSNPCIAYLMEENTLLMQALVIAHASFGHNYFFKNNYLFKQWTDAESIIDYLLFAKKYIKECEDKHGINEVEALLDACHALQYHGVDKYKRAQKLSAAQEENLRDEREKYNQSQVNEIWNTIPKSVKDKDDPDKEPEEKFPSEPQENILYFIEKNAPRLKTWQREIVRIVRKVSQYFYPQYQTKIMNEGCATFFHYKLIHDLFDQGFIDEGAMMEFYASHTAVTRQPDYDKGGSSMNPYALGYAMFCDIERISMTPTQEDRDWFRGQEWVGNGDWLKNVKWAIENFKDESFILQFLSPKVMRDFRLFAYVDDERDPELEITAIHNDRGYKAVREALAKQNNIGYMIPDIQVVDVDRWNDRSMTLKHFMVDRVPLDPKTTDETIRYLCWLWGYPITLQTVDETGEVRAEYHAATFEKTKTDLFLADD
jgi:stage V sporulation protein R